MSDGPLIQIEGLSKSFETAEGSLEVLRGLDFEIQAGDRVAIMGQSGVGKSTLLGDIARGTTAAEQMVTEYHSVWGGSIEPVFLEYAY